MNFYSLGVLLFTITQIAALQMYYFHTHDSTLRHSIDDAASPVIPLQIACAIY